MNREKRERRGRKERKERKERKGGKEGKERKERKVFSGERSITGVFCSGGARLNRTLSPAPFVVLRCNLTKQPGKEHFGLGTKNIAAF